MRPLSSPRRYTSGVLAALSLTAVISATACTPITAISHVATQAANGANGADGASVGTVSAPKPVATKPTNPRAMPFYSAYDTHVASTHVVRAPALNAYPWANDQSWSIDAYGETRRQCVSYAAWYINAHGTPFGYYTQGPRGVGVFGDASNWAYAASRAGFTVSTTPKVGSVAQWDAYESLSWNVPGGWRSFTAGGAGHVAIVTRVYSNGNVDIAQYNMNDQRSFSIMNNIRAPRYIYIPLSSPHVP